MKITRSFLGVVLTLCMVLGSMTSTVFAVEPDIFISNGIEYEVIGTIVDSAADVRVIGGTVNQNNEIDIPDTISSDGITYTVTEIGSDAFKSNTAVEKVSLPQYIEKIGASAFDGCSNLYYVDFNENSGSVSIGEHVFKNCSSLTSINIPSLNSIHDATAFEDCNTVVVQPNSAGGKNHTIYGNFKVDRDGIYPSENPNDTFIAASSAQIIVDGTLRINNEADVPVFLVSHIVRGNGVIENIRSDGSIIGAYSALGTELKVYGSDASPVWDFTDRVSRSDADTLDGFNYEGTTNTLYLKDGVYILPDIILSDGATIVVGESQVARVYGNIVTTSTLKIGGKGIVKINDFASPAVNVNVTPNAIMDANRMEANSLYTEGTADVGYVRLNGGALTVVNNGLIALKPRGYIGVTESYYGQNLIGFDYAGIATPDVGMSNINNGETEDVPYLYIRAAVAQQQQPTGGGGGTIRYTVSYYSGIDEINSVSEKVKRNSKITLPDASVFEVAEDGTMLAGWADRRNGDVKYSIGEEVTVKENMSLYAVWGGSGTGDGKPSLNTEDHILYLQGYPDGTIKPLDNITRAEAAMIYYRLLDDKTREEYRTTEHPFTDVAADHWALEAIATIYNAGMTVGRTETTYEPDADITRAEYALIAARFDSEEYNESLDIFNDTGDHWAKEDIARAAARGWILGYEDGSFKPDAPIIRAEAVTFINRVLKRDPETIDDLLDGMFTFTDNLDITAWYYIDIQEASNDHEYTRKENGTEKWTGLGIGKDR